MHSHLRIPLYLGTMFSLGFVTTTACGDAAPSDTSLGGGGSSSVLVGSGGTNTGSGGTTTRASGGSTGGSSATDPCAKKDGTLLPSVSSVVVTSAHGGAPKKGDALQLTIELKNTGTGVGPMELTPLLTSLRFDDYSDVPLGKKSFTLCSGTTKIEITGGPFLDREDLDKHYALGSGDYQLAAFRSSINGTEALLTPPSETKFTIESSTALLVPVVYDEGYFSAVNGLTTATPEAYLTQSFTRPGQVFTPSSNADPDGPGNFDNFPAGFDEMMGVQHHFRSFSGFPGESTLPDQGWCEDAAAYGKKVLGMTSDWGGGQGTKAERHGFDYLIALHPSMGGGVACGWLDVQVSSLINTDLDRQQIVLVHESGHIFGAPHCDDVGNGSGGPLQGYVMCSGEKHPNYPEYFVWHSTSRAAMSSKWD